MRGGMVREPMRAAMYGMAAGAAGTTVINGVTYLDMVLRGRPASATPQDTVRRMEEATNVSLSREGPDSEVADNRRSALGALLGIAMGVGAGAIYGLLGGLLVAVLKLKLNIGPVLGVIALNVAITFSVPNISFLAHAGGFVVGAALMAAMLYAPAKQRGAWQVGAFVVTAVVLAGLTLYRYNANVVRQITQNIEVARQAKAFEAWVKSLK